MAPFILLYLVSLCVFLNSVKNDAHGPSTYFQMKTGPPQGIWIVTKIHRIVIVPVSVFYPPKTLTDDRDREQTDHLCWGVIAIRDLGLSN